MKYAHYPLLVFILSVGLVGCYHARVITDEVPSTKVIDKTFASSWINGLVPPSTVDAVEECPYGVAMVETELSFLNQLVGGLTFGIYTPMHIKVTCAAPTSAAFRTPSQQPAVSESRSSRVQSQQPSQVTSEPEVQSTAQAQQQVMQPQPAGFAIGPRLGLGRGLFIGADARFNIEDLPIVINPTFDSNVMEGGDIDDFRTNFLQLGINGLYHFEVSNQDLLPYVGGGLTMIRYSYSSGRFGEISGSDTTFGLNLLGGSSFLVSDNLRPFGQTQLTLLGNDTRLTIIAGLLFGL